MADIICRWRNASAKTVCQLVSVLPKEQMSSERFRDIMDKQTLFTDFFHTAYQLACQLGLYCEENGMYIPRFTHDINEEEAESYLSHWIKWYYAPNPFTKSLKASDTPKYLVGELFQYVEEHGPSPLRETLESIYNDRMGNLDIVTNAINNYSDILKIDNQIVYLSDNFMDYMNDMPDRYNRDLFFRNFDKQEKLSNTEVLDEPLQQIFFGAPGTGKSHTINKACAKYDNYRTTFHPDTDYSSFVGSYKPITEVVTKYDQYGHQYPEKRIVYTYVFQSFLQAYIKAWEQQAKENPEPVFLVIEEINRGNCAQIFGDIFQLLDRNAAGFSDYPIVADKDLAQELKEQFKNLVVANRDKINALYEGGKDVVGSVLSGEKLLLPNNLYIWATMNTSDQSLFPIDSAFKRRWDWKYIKIKNHTEKPYTIEFKNGNTYDWWQFVDAINREIEGGEIQQEDKKLGYFFAKSADGKISADRFLSKVIFYLYTDVFKDFGFEEPFFKDENGETMTFASYFDEEGKANEAQVELFLNNLGLEPSQTDSYVEDAELDENDDYEEDDDQEYSLVVKWPSGEKLSLPSKNDTYVEALKRIGIDRAAKGLEGRYRLKDVPVISKTKSPKVEGTNYKYVKVGDWYVLTGIDNHGSNLRHLSKMYNLDLDIKGE